jgi:cytoskeletal protein CcmA (bactofilin family)
MCTNINITLVFDGGAFTNYDGEGFILPNLEFSNGGSIAPGYGPDNYGRFMVKEFFTVRGDVPFEWNLSSASRNNVNRTSQEALSINGHPENVFDIADVTDDSMPDATFGIPFIIGYGYFRDTPEGNHLVDDWKFGFRKTGLGTMRITAPRHVQSHKSTKSGRGSISINGDPKVEEGELRVDGDLSFSDTVRVYVGAYLSGTGLVNNVSIAQGGGFRVRSGQKDKLQIKGNLAIGENMVIDVDLAEGESVTEAKAEMFTVDGALSGIENLSSAKILADGVSVPNIKLRFKDNGLSLRYMRGTTMVIR